MIENRSEVEPGAELAQVHEASRRIVVFPAGVVNTDTQRTVVLKLPVDFAFVVTGDEAATFLRKLLKAVAQGAKVGVFEAGFTLINLGFGEQVLG